MEKTNNKRTANDAQLPPGGRENDNEPELLGEFTVSKQNTPYDPTAWQIKAQECRGGIMTFFLQKSRKSGKNEQPYVRDLVNLIRHNAKLRESCLGLSFIAARRNPENGLRLPPAEVASAKDLPWYIFVARKVDVWNMTTWMHAVEKFLNRADIRLDEKLFKYPPRFQVTSYGKMDPKTDEPVISLLQEEVTDADVLDILVDLYDLRNPQIRRKFDEINIPFKDYFLNSENGRDSLKQHIRGFDVYTTTNIKKEEDAT